MPYNLKGRNVLITGGSSSNIAVNYNENEERARQVTDKITKDYGTKAVVVKGDVGLLADCERIVEEAIKGLGGLDVIISNAGWTKFTEFGNLDACDEEEWDKDESDVAVNCKANLHLLRKALPTLKSNPDGGVFLVTASVAAIGQTGSSMAYAVSKAAAVHLMKCLAGTQGPKIRVNAVLPGLLLTEWGQKFKPEQVQAVKDKSLLKMETDLEDCADAYVAAAKNTSMTGQNIQIDAGLAMK